MSRNHAVVTDDDLAVIAAATLAIDGYASEAASFIRGQQVNRILFSGTVITDSTGIATLDFEVPFASFTWWPAGASQALFVTFTTDGPVSGGPGGSSGPGVYRFGAIPNPPSLMPATMIPATGRSLSIYSTTDYAGLIPTPALAVVLVVSSLSPSGGR